MFTIKCEGRGSSERDCMDRLSNVIFGGYDKVATLRYIDQLTSEIYALEAAIDKKNRGEYYDVPFPVPEIQLKSTALGGFDKNDVDSYVLELRGQILELRERLG